MQSMLTVANVSDESILWATLAILIGLVVLVGQKAEARDVQLNANTGYKHPMLAFEMNAGAAPQMFKSWDEETKSRLRTALLWDYLFIFIYPAAIATACFIAARFLANKGIMPIEYGLIIIFLQLVAAILDAAENFALLRVLGEAIRPPWPQLARWCAISKFGLIIVGLIYALIIGGGTWLILLIRNVFISKGA